MPPRVIIDFVILTPLLLPYKINIDTKQRVWQRFKLILYILTRQTGCGYCRVRHYQQT
jgi:hypothetical protein